MQLYIILVLLSFPGYKGSITEMWCHFQNLPACSDPPRPVSKCCSECKRLFPIVPNEEWVSVAAGCCPEKRRSAKLLFCAPLLFLLRKSGAGAHFHFPGHGDNHHIFSPIDHFIYPHSSCFNVPMLNKKQMDRKPQKGQYWSYSGGCHG